MRNLVGKFMPLNLQSSNDEGTVALEYVLVAGFVVVGVGLAISTTDLWQNLQDKLNTIPL